MTDEKTNLTDEMTAVLEEIVETPEKEKTKGEVVLPINDTEFIIGSRKYQLVTNYREGFNAERLGERFSEVLAKYDYIVGDWGYEQLRLKGFFDVNNRKSLPDQRIDTLEDYLYEFCNFGCAYFVIQRIGGKREKSNAKRRKKKTPTQAHISEKKEVVKDRKRSLSLKIDRNKNQKIRRKQRKKKQMRKRVLQFEREKIR